MAKKILKEDKKAVPQKGCQTVLLNTEGKSVGKISLPKEIFEAKINPTLMAQAVRVFLANQRQGTQKTKTRGEVKISTAKIYRQKGTGRARHGAKSAPIFVGGGVAHGPRPRDYSLKMTQKMRRAALFSALTSKLKEDAIVAVEGLEEVQPKTREMVKILDNLKIGFQKGKQKKGRKNFLLVLPGKLENLERSARNIVGVTLKPANLLNTYLVLNHQELLFLKDSISVLEKTFLGKKEKVEKEDIEKETGKERTIGVQK